jgi:isoquinoline 1-oxidoreductase beta subunit
MLVGGGVGVGLIVAFAAWPRELDSDLPRQAGEQAFGHFIKIGRDGRVTVAVPQVEYGQGVWTALPQIVADELGAAWDSIGVEPAPLTGAYGNPLARSEGWLEGFGPLRAHRINSDGRTRITAGSTSVRAWEQPMREAAAVARAMLIAAAAERWNVGQAECSAAGGMVRGAGRALGFGDLAEAAATQRAPGSATLRTGNTDRLIGKPLQRIDAPSKSNGSLLFAGDVRLPGLLFASVRLAPPGGRLTGYSREKVNGVGGVRYVSASDGWMAIAAETWWAAERAIRAADPKFTGPTSPPALRPLFDDALAADEVQTWFSSGDYDRATADSRALAANYYVAPSLHLGLEPDSATARIKDGKLDLWAPTLAPGLARTSVAEAAGMSSADVGFYPMPVGDSGGRAIESNAAAIAAELARVLERPVQVTLSQGASQNHDRPAPGALARLTALPSPAGPPTAWQMRVATGDGLGASIARLAGTDALAELGQTALDGAVPPYAIANLRIQASRVALPFATAAMRGSPQRELCFATESFVDELARATGREPLAYRMMMLGGAPRLARCLQAAAQAARWDGGGAGSTMGLAGCSAFGSHIGLVAVASIEQAAVRVHKLVAAVDCGRVVNPDLVVQQLEGGLLWALGQAVAGEAEWVAGMARSRPIGGIALPRIGDTPEIVVQILNSDLPPGGVSALGTTVLAPAVANAIFAGTGKRLRDLPFDLTAAA